MLVDRSALSAGQTLDADLVVIGAGAAGITIARQLANTATRVLLVEGGGYEPSERSQALYAMAMDDRYAKNDREKNYATRERLRFFGGTTNHWAGWCRPLEPEDFGARAWVPDSGWPLTFDELRPWYEQAQPILGLARFADQVGAPPDHQVGLGADFTTRRFHFSHPPTRFGPRYKAELEAAPNVQVLLEANVLRLHASADKARVERASVQLEDGPRIDVAGRAFVLATGGLENPRVLLLSEEESPGAFNRHDLVGRYFMEHPHDSRAGQLAFALDADEQALRRIYVPRPKDADGMRRKHLWFLTPETQQREQLLQASLEVRKSKRVTDGKLAQAVDSLLTTQRSLGDAPSTARGVLLWTRCENAPRRDSRVYLGDETDRLGLRKGRIAWRLGELEARTVRWTLERFAARMGATSKGRVRIDVDRDEPFRKTWGGAHHMGTTRMADDPTRGVVDRDCKVHGLDNLWVGGSSVYPTSGVSNPTFTLTALALRLADHLKGVLAP